MDLSESLHSPWYLENNIRKNNIAICHLELQLVGHYINIVLDINFVNIFILSKYLKFNWEHL